MVEFWASVGLACFNQEFFEKIIQENSPQKAGGALDEWQLRLSLFEFTELRRLLKDPELLECIRKFQMKMSVMKCPPPPRPCPYRLGAEVFEAWVAEFKKFIREEAS